MISPSAKHPSPAGTLQRPSTSISKIPAGTLRPLSASISKSPATPAGTLRLLSASISKSPATPAETLRLLSASISKSPATPAGTLQPPSTSISRIPAGTLRAPSDIWPQKRQQGCPLFQCPLFLRLSICLLLFSLLAPAQNRAQFPWWNSPVAAEIGLSQQQTIRIRQIVRSYRDRLFDARNAVQKAEAALDDVMNDSEMNAEAARPIIERVAQARANSSRVFLEMSTRIREVLTFEQWRQLVQRWDEVKGKKLSDTLLTPQ